VWGDGFVPESHSTIQDNGGRYDQGRVFSAAIKSSGHPLVKKAARVAVDVRALTFLRVIPSMRSAFFLTFRTNILSLQHNTNTES
jgi:hypothetical protein